MSGLHFELSRLYENGVYATLNDALRSAPQIASTSIRRLDLEPDGQYVAGSVSMLPLSCGGYLWNVRYSNDRSCVGNGLDAYTTKNKCLRVDSEFNKIGDIVEMQALFPSKYPNCQNRGVEDLRLYQGDDGVIKWIGASREYSHIDGFRQVIGTYHEEAHELRGGTSIRSPHTGTVIEKNWIPVGGNHLIYKWHPFTTCSVNFATSPHTLTSFSQQETPGFFRHVRGSTIPIEHRDGSYCLAHLSTNDNGRPMYYHMLIRLCRTGKNVEAYTNPFYFMDRAIEYSLGMVIKDDTMHVIVSRMDRDPVLASIPMSAFQFFSMP